MTDDRLHDLITRHFHGELSAVERAELSAELSNSPAARQVFAELSVLMVGLAGQFPRVAVSPPPRRRSRLRWVAAVTGLAAALLVAVWALRPAPAPPEGPGLDRLVLLTQSVGDVRIDGRRVPDTHGLPPALGSGAVVSTHGITASAVVRCSDGTAIVLAGDTVAELEERGNRVVIRQGQVSASIPARPADDPMTISTPEAEVEAGGAMLSVGRSPHQTEVGVISGHARVTTPAGTPLMEMTSGDHALVEAGGTATKQWRPTIPESYAWVPHLPPPAGWVGRPMAEPDGTAVFRAVYWDDPYTRRTTCQIRSDNGWTRGLVALYPDSRIRVRYRVDKPGRGQFLIVVRPDPPAAKEAVVLEVPRPFEAATPGEWQTIDVRGDELQPENRPTISFGPPWVGFLVIFNTYEPDLGLRVAEFSVTRGPHHK